MKDFLFGKLTLDALPHHWYTIGGTVFMAVAGLIGCDLSHQTPSAGVGFGRSGSHPPIPKK